MSYTKQQRAIAKANGWALITVDVDLRTAQPPAGALTFQGPLPRDLAEKLVEFMTRLWNEKLERQP